MDFTTKNQHLLRLAAKYLWWTAPNTIASEGVERLVANVMEMGTWDDAACLLEVVGTEVFLHVLNAPPPGVISDKSLAFWHYRLGGNGRPSRSRSRFN